MNPSCAQPGDRMPLTPPFSPTISQGDLYYGLATHRDALMRHLGVSFDHAVGARVNSFDVGDVKVATQDRPQDNKFFADFLGAHPKYSRSAGAEKYASSVPMAMLWRHWREKSKGGIEWQTKVRKKVVHFCLDGMMDPMIQYAITTKSWDNETDNSSKTVPWDQKVRAITNAELRWIYRNRKDPDVDARVQCWEGNAPCPPPWGRGDGQLDALWKAYKA